MSLREVGFRLVLRLASILQILLHRVPVTRYWESPPCDRRDLRDGPGLWAWAVGPDEARLGCVVQPEGRRGGGFPMKLGLNQVARWAGFVALALMAAVTARADKNIVLIAGKISHGPGDHEFRAGSLLLQKCLSRMPGITVQVHSNGWPTDESVFQNADAVLIYADGGGGHPAIQGERMKLMDSLAARGVGLGFAHYGVEVPKGDPGAAMHRWVKKG